MLPNAPQVEVDLTKPVPKPHSNGFIGLVISVAAGHVHSLMVKIHQNLP